MKQSVFKYIAIISSIVIAGASLYQSKDIKKMIDIAKPSIELAKGLNTELDSQLNSQSAIVSKYEKAYYSGIGGSVFLIVGATLVFTLMKGRLPVYLVAGSLYITAGVCGWSDSIIYGLAVIIPIIFSMLSGKKIGEIK
tara:strand:- start:72 stop:488 length:417 start_codon:yes stop_codon:yes gene_type:complete